MASWIAGEKLPAWALIAALTVLFIVLGCFLDGISIVLLTTSVVLPALQAAGIDMLWFGILIVLVSAWLVWRARSQLTGLAVHPLRWASVVVLLLSLTWLVASRASILTVHAVRWPVLAWSAVLATCGRRAARALAFPIAYLWFAVPVWGYVNGILNWMTVLATGLLLKATQVPAVIAGNSVFIPSGHFQIVGGCSGLHFLIVGLAISTLVGEVHRDRLGTRLLLVLLAVALALVSNWLRVYVIILAGHLTDMKRYCSSGRRIRRAK